MIIIQTHVIPATTFRGTRIAAVSNTGRRLVVAMDYSESNPHEAAARALAVKMGRSDALLTAVDYPRGGMFAVE